VSIAVIWHLYVDTASAALRLAVCCTGADCIRVGCVVVSTACACKLASIAELTGTGQIAGVSTGSTVQLALLLLHGFKKLCWPWHGLC
jgi:hypothetical protein